jgi:outer membrane protein assembly factor BamB
LVRVGLTIMLTAVAALYAASAAADTTSFQVDETHSGFVDAKLDPPLGRRWIRRDLGQASYPLIAAGKVFVSRGGLLHALDRTRGDTVWSRPTDGGHLAFGHERLFVSGQETLAAVDPDDGRTIWTVPSEASAAIVVGEIVVTSGHYELAGYRWQDGIKVWSTTAVGSGTGIPAADGERVFTTGACNSTAATHAALGVELWHHYGGCSGGGGGTPIVHGEHVHAPDHPWVALRRLDGAVEGSLRMHVPALADGRVFDVIPGEHTFAGELRATDLATGTVAWRVPPPHGSSGFFGPPLIVGDVLFVRIDAPDGPEEMAAVDPSSGRLLWRRPQSILPRDFSELHTAGMAADSEMLIVPAQERLIAFWSGPDEPGVDDPDRPHPSSVRLQLYASSRRTVYGRGVVLHAQAQGTYRRRLDLQQSPYPYRRWQTIARPGFTNTSSWSRRVRPSVNTRYRLVDRGTLPAKVSRSRQVFVEISVRLRFFLIRPGQIRVVARLSAPPRLRLDRRRLYVYRYRSRRSSGVRVGALDIRRSGRRGRYRVRGVIRPPGLRRGDLFGICVKKMPPPANRFRVGPLRGCGNRRI